MKKIKLFLKLSWQISPAYIVFLVINSLISGIEIMLNVILSAMLIQEIIETRQINQMIYIGLGIVSGNIIFYIVTQLSHL